MNSNGDSAGPLKTLECIFRLRARSRHHHETRCGDYRSLGHCSCSLEPGLRSQRRSNKGRHETEFRWAVQP